MRPALWLFAFGCALRVLFWLSAPDWSQPWQPGFQGDAPVWQQLCATAGNGADELWRLPLRPPAMQWFAALCWDGQPGGAWPLLLLFAGLGALVGPLVYLLLRPHLANGTALLAGGLCAASSNLLLLGSGLHAELPYLVLLLVSWLDHEALRLRPTLGRALRFGALHGVLCLWRAEHVLTFALWFLVLWRQGAVGLARTTALAIGAAAAVLLPWQLHAAGQIEAYNQAGAPTLPAPGQQLGRGLPWTAAALDRLRTLPAFQQRPVYQFVTDTAQKRGRGGVDAADLEVVVEAYGAWPEPLPTPFLCLYGGLNFFLANSPEAQGGFATGALDRDPPLLRQPERFPDGIVQQLPRQRGLVLSYPPHLHAVAHGYQLGLADLAADPAGAVQRWLRKLWYGLEGALGGVGGYAIPIGLSGERRPVDMVTASSTFAAFYRAALLAVATTGLLALRRAPWLLPWLVYAAGKLLVLLLFFGYARQGALLVPVAAIGLAAAIAPRLRRREPGAPSRWPAYALVLLLVLETVRTLSVTTWIDGRPAGLGAPAGGLDHAVHRIDYR